MTGTIFHSRQQWMKVPFCFTSSWAFDAVKWDFGYSNRCVVVYHCYFHLHFLNDIWCWTHFPMPIFHLYILFCEVSVKVFGLLIKSGCFSNYWVLRVLCILLKIGLYQIGLLQIFYPNLTYILSIFFCRVVFDFTST